jgi:hypothetical protein
MVGGITADFTVACFTAGTPIVVDLEGNSRSIEELEVGDTVLARSEFDPTGPLELKRIEEKFVRTAAVMELVIGGRSIKTTAEHPFYVPAQGKFVPAGELQAGDELVSHTGELVRIDTVSPLGELTTVYNLRVADHHTYFVGGHIWAWDVWVHNAYNAPKSGDELAELARQDALRHMREADLDLDPHDLEFYGGDGVIYEVPGFGTPSGRPYIGSADVLAERARTATDGRNRYVARQVGSYPVGNRDARRLAEQTAIDDRGGIEMLDNRRNEIRKRNGN